MVYLRRLVLSSSFSYLERFFADRGGLFQISSHGGSIPFALKCSVIGPPPPKENHPATALNALPATPSCYSIWIADNGFLYAPSLYHERGLPLNQLLIVKVNEAEEVWNVGLEAIQTGLFSSVLLRPSRACHAHYLRKLQLAAERMKAKVFIIAKFKLPHWTLKANIGELDHAHSLLSKFCSSF